MKVSLCAVFILAILFGSVVPIVHGQLNEKRDVHLVTSITTDWYEGQKWGKGIREFAINQAIYAIQELSADNNDNHTVEQRWWWDNGTGLKLYSECYFFNWRPYWDPIESELSFPEKGQGRIEILVDNVSLGYTNWFAVNNTKPEKPNIERNFKTKVNISQTFNFTDIDPDGFNVSFFIDWGDNTTTNWTDFTPSSLSMQLSHTWTKKGEYIILFKTRDRALNESECSATIVKTPYIPEHPILNWLLKHFPHAFPLLRQLYGE